MLRPFVVLTLAPFLALFELDLFKANMTSYVQIVRFHIAQRSVPTASSILGMEKFLTLRLTEEYKIRRGKLTMAVLNEARRQRKLAARGGPHSVESADRLAKVAAENSKRARERARAAALFLEQDLDPEKRRAQKHPIQNHQGSIRLQSLPHHMQRNRHNSPQERKRLRMTPSTSNPSPASMETASYHTRATREAFLDLIVLVRNTMPLFVGQSQEAIDGKGIIKHSYRHHSYLIFLVIFRVGWYFVHKPL